MSSSKMMWENPSHTRMPLRFCPDQTLRLFPEQKEGNISYQVGLLYWLSCISGKFAEIATVRILPNSAVGFNFAVLPLRIPKNDQVEISAKAYNSENIVLDHIKRYILVEVITISIWIVKMKALGSHWCSCSDFVTLSRLRYRGHSESIFDFIFYNVGQLYQWALSFAAWGRYSGNKGNQDVWFNNEAEWRVHIQFHFPRKICPRNTEMLALSIL